MKVKIKHLSGDGILIVGSKQFPFKGGVVSVSVEDLKYLRETLPGLVEEMKEEEGHVHKKG